VQRHLVVFLRAPRMGRAKRRLARDVGAVAAWRFHRIAAARLLRRLGHPGGVAPWRCWLAVTPDREAGAVGRWAGRPWRALPQGPGDLGRRMGRAMATLPPGPVIIVGADIPDIRAAHVAEAFRRLGDHAGPISGCPSKACAGAAPMPSPTPWPAWAARVWPGWRFCATSTGV
jgi:glycosyltransferase A (GT-A) superfamily protein (DUF2064 family)